MLLRLGQLLAAELRQLPQRGLALGRRRVVLVLGADVDARLLADRDVRPEAAAAVVAAGGRLKRLSVEDPSLEAIYTHYFQAQADHAQGDRDAA